MVYQGSERTTGCQFSFTCDGSLARVPIRFFWSRAEQVARAALAGYTASPPGSYGPGLLAYSGVLEPLRHAAIERGADVEPMFVASSVAGRKRARGIVAGDGCSSQPMLGKVQQGRTQQRGIGDRAWVVVGWTECPHLAGLFAEMGSGGRTSGGEADWHLGGCDSLVC